MIVRAVLAFGMAWILMPHHPDLGLGTPNQLPGESFRDAIFARLSQVRSEIAKTGLIEDQATLVWDDGRGAVLQKAGRLPGGGSEVPVIVGLRP